MNQLTFLGQLTQWSKIFSQFDVSFIPLKAVKHKALANFLAAHALPTDSRLNDYIHYKLFMNLEGVISSY